MAAGRVETRWELLRRPAALSSSLGALGNLLFALFVGLFLSLHPPLYVNGVLQLLVQMPPALLLTMQVLLGVLAGVVGVIFATPLTAAAMVMVKK